MLVNSIICWTVLMIILSTVYIACNVLAPQLVPVIKIRDFKTKVSAVLTHRKSRIPWGSSITIFSLFSFLSFRSGLSMSTA